MKGGASDTGGKPHIMVCIRADAPSDAWPHRKQDEGAPPDAHAYRKRQDKQDSCDVFLSLGLLQSQNAAA